MGIRDEGFGTFQYEGNRCAKKTFADGVQYFLRLAYCIRGNVHVIPWSRGFHGSKIDRSERFQYAHP